MGKKNSKVSAYKGVSWHVNSQSWQASITVKGIIHNCGFHKDDREAAKSRDMKILRLGLNKPLQVLKRL